MASRVAGAALSPHENDRGDMGERERVETVNLVGLARIAFVGPMWRARARTSCCSATI
jgi:hypothetical protein